jgi:hypothetical protein
LSPTDTTRHRLPAIATQAQTAAEALDGAALDFPPPEMDRFALQLDSIGSRLEGVCERLSVGVDPQRSAPGAVRGPARASRGGRS